MRLREYLRCFPLTWIFAVVIIYFTWSKYCAGEIRFPASKLSWKTRNGTVNKQKEPLDRKEGHIWFLETTYQHKLSARQACSIESACRHNDDFIVHLLSTGNISSSECAYHRLISKFPNFHSSELNASVELAETPLAPLHAKGGALHRSPHAVSHLSDFLRYSVLWKRGGVYLDTDVLVLKSLKGMRNSAFYESNVTVASSVLIFEKHHPVLKILTDKCARAYDPNDWITCGPRIMSLLPSDAEFFNYHVRIFKESLFFAVPWHKWEYFFNSKMAPEVLRMVNRSYGVHFWNNFSKNRRIVHGSRSAMDVLARRHCPEVYRLASSDGYL
ncbi:lactosylceramide 4-alpha-galactosyltransferase-like [Rhipicephalus sanguineus]|uniref:lactosylceramide 4-alpha-galactosyltransferase-like n=1 Tax=Rhipicephalus sanguineus TaxID=34632 RepID=UPI0020C3ACF6|nr:lactosylceramide 4-alpha-galactosyltransferase-like [Rhipicephalus sanguineus]